MERISVAVVVNEDLVLKDEEPEEIIMTMRVMTVTKIPLSPQNQQDVEARKALEVERLTTLVKELLVSMKKR